MLTVSIRLGIVYAISKIPHDFFKSLIADYYVTTCKNTGGWGGGSSAKALEGALRPETESTVYKKLRHSTLVS